MIKLFKGIVAVLILTSGCSTKDPNVETVSPEVFDAKLSRDTASYLLDVRRPEEFKCGHIPKAHQLNWLDSATFKHQAPTLDKTKTIYVYCRSGRRSNAAAAYLSGMGYTVVDLDGGILAWEKAGLPIAK